MASALSQWTLCLNHLPGPGCSVSWVRCDSTVSALPCVSSGKLTSGCYVLADVNCPGSQEDVVSIWEPAHSLVENAGLGLRLQQPLAFSFWLSLACLSASGAGEGPVCSRLALLRYSLNPLFCERARLRIRSFHRKRSLSLFFPSLAIPQFGLLSHVISLGLSSGHSDQVLTLSTNVAAAPPCSASPGWCQKQASGLLLCWQLRLGAYSVVCLFFSPSYVAP